MSISASPADKLDPRVRRTRALIQGAFLELLAEKSFQAISVKDITQRAEINRATFYAHFPDKYALLEATIAQTFRQELTKRTLSACRFSLENLRALISTVCEYLVGSDTHCKVSDSQFEMLVERQVRKQVQDLLEMWLREVGLDTDVRTAAIAASWTIYGLALQWSENRNREPVETYVERVLPLIVSNLRLKTEEMGSTLSAA